MEKNVIKHHFIRYLTYKKILDLTHVIRTTTNNYINSVNITDALNYVQEIDCRSTFFLSRTRVAI